MSIYQTIYDLIETYIFTSVEVGTYQELICIALSSCACIFLIALPFLIVWRIIRLFV